MNWFGVLVLLTTLFKCFEASGNKTLRNTGYERRPSPKSEVCGNRKCPYYTLDQSYSCPSYFEKRTYNISRWFYTEEMVKSLIGVRRITAKRITDEINRNNYKIAIPNGACINPLLAEDEQKNFHRYWYIDPSVNNPVDNGRVTIVNHTVLTVYVKSMVLCNHLDYPSFIKRGLDFANELDQAGVKFDARHFCMYGYNNPRDAKGYFELWIRAD